MKTSLTVFALTAFALAAGAQATTAQSAGSAAESAHAAGQAGEMPASAAQATQVSAVLSKRIDSRNARVGDEVLAKTTSEAKLADGTKIPKGSRLVGHVTEVEPKSHENRDGHVAFCFDHAVLRNGQEIPVRVLMRSMAAPPPLSTSDDMAASGGMMAPGGMMAGGSGAPASGGMLDGVPGQAIGPLQHGIPGVADRTATGLAANTRSAADVAGSTTANTASLAPETGNVTGAAGSYAAFSGPVVNLSGVSFATVHAGAAQSGVSGSANSATMLTAHGRNVTLESGSQMTMAVSAQR